MKGTHPLRDFFFGSLTRVIVTVILSILLFALMLNACSPAPQYAPAPVAQVQQAPGYVGQPPVIVQQVPSHDGFWSGYMMGHMFSGGYGYRAPVVVQRTIIAPTVVRPAYVAPVPRAITPSYTPRPSAWTSTNSRGISTTTSRSSISVGRRR